MSTTDSGGPSKDSKNHLCDNENRCQALIQTHQTMLGALRQREADILKFVGFLVAGLSVFFYSVYQRYDTVTSVQLLNCNQDNLLLLGSVFSMLILAIGGLYVAALGYNFRSILLFICRMEMELSIHKYKPKKWPKYSNKRSDFKAKYLPPELLAVYWWSFIALLTVIAVSSCWIIIGGPADSTVACKTKEWSTVCQSFLAYGSIAVIVVVYSVSLISVLGGTGWYCYKLHKLYDEEFKHYK